MIKEYLLLGLFCSGFISGAYVNGWRISASHSEEMIEKNTNIVNLHAAIASQTASISILGAKYSEAMKIAKTAQNESAIARSKLKKAKIASTCEAAVDQLWESIQ